MFVITISKAQIIPNSGFEKWTSMGTYNNPDSWTCLNNMTASASTYTCDKGTPGNSGAGYLKLTSKMVGSNVVPGVAVCGTINTKTFQAGSGFPCTGRPQNFTGKWQHMIYGSSQGFIDILLTRWDANSKKRITVASVHEVLSGMAMSWAGFSIPLTYTDGNSPDSCIITMSSSGSTPTNGDYLWVDNLAFTGSVAGVSKNYFSENISLFPNPSLSNLSIDLSVLKDQKVSIQVIDMEGKLVLKVDEIIVSKVITLDVSSLSKGNYILNIISNDGTITKKIIKE